MAQTIQLYTLPIPKNIQMQTTEQTALKDGGFECEQEGTRYNCVPEESRHRGGRRATQQAPEARSGSTKLTLIHISSEPVQNQCRTFGTGSIAAAVPAHSKATSPNNPLLFYSLNDIADDCLSTSCWLLKFTVCHINKQIHEHSNCSLSCTAFYCCHKHFLCSTANQLWHWHGFKRPILHWKKIECMFG